MNIKKLTFSQVGVPVSLRDVVSPPAQFFHAGATLATNFRDVLVALTLPVQTASVCQ